MPSRLEIERYMVVLRKFVDVFCRTHHHGRRPGELCGRCRALLDYARRRLSRCPHDPKPMCKDCETQCYREPYRGQMRRVMRFGAGYFARRCRLDVLLRGWKSR